MTLRPDTVPAPRSPLRTALAELRHRWRYRTSRVRWLRGDVARERCRAARNRGVAHHWVHARTPDPARPGKLRDVYACTRCTASTAD